MAGIEDINQMTRPVHMDSGGMLLKDRLAKIDSNLASVRLDKNKFFDLIVDAGYVKEDGSADVKKFNRAAKRAGIDVKDRSNRNMQKITKFLNEKSGGSYKNVAKLSSKSLAENAASRSKGFLGEYAEQYSAATKEEFWNDAKKLQRKVNKEKISSLDKVKKIARGLKLKWAVPIGVTTTLLSKMGFGAVGHLITTEMGDAELPKEPMIDKKKIDFSGPSANAQLLEQMSQDAAMIKKRGGGMMNVNEMTRPLGYWHGGLHEEDNRLPGNLNKAELFALARANNKKEQNEILPGNLNRTELKLLQETKPEKTGMFSGLMSLIKNIRENAFAPEQREDGGAEYMKMFDFLWGKGYSQPQIDAILSGEINQEDVVPERENLDEKFKG